VEKNLGPTAEYLGGGLRAWTEKRVQNVATIFNKAQEKLGPEIEKAGSVPPRVLKEVLDEGSFCDDELTAEYFGGILASSRTPSGRDDRGRHICVSRLSCTSGLARAELIDIAAWGTPDHLNTFGKSRSWNEVTEPGMTACPKQFGNDYFLWAIGAGSVNRADFLSPQLKLPKLPDIKFHGSPIRLVKEEKKI
jgi:hypothetical protein